MYTYICIYIKLVSPFFVFSYVPQFIQFPSKFLVFIFLFVFFQFYSVVFHKSASPPLFCCLLSRSKLVWPRLGDPFVSQNLRELCEFHSPGQILDCVLFLSFRVFHISDNWWLFKGVWVTASLLKSPGLSSIFWSFSIMLPFGWSPLIRQLPSHRGPLIIL